MPHRIALGVVVLPLAIGIAHAQSPKPKFEVASVKRCINPPAGTLLGPPDDQSAPSVFSVVQDLGLKLQAIAAPRQYLIVDRVHRPSEN